MRTPFNMEVSLKRKGYSEKAIKEIWKWYDFSERSGVNFLIRTRRNIPVKEITRAFN